MSCVVSNSDILPVQERPAADGTLSLNFIERLVFGAR